MNIPDDLFPILKDDFNKIMYLYSSEQLPLEKDVINFWKDAIYGYCLMTKSLLVSRDNIYKAFEISDIEPVSLLPAFRYLVSKGDLVPSSMSSSSSSSSSNLLSASLSWVTYLSSFLSKQLDQSTNSGEEQVIFTPMLYFLTQAIILRYVNSSYPTGVSVYLRPPPGCSSAALVANTHECETFKDLLHLLATDSYQSSVNTSNNKVVYVRALLSDLPDTQYDILAQHLIKTGAATLSADGFAIHIHGGKLASSVSSEAEFAKLALRQTLSSVRTRISTCDRRATEYVKQAKEFKARGNDKAALVHLRLKRGVCETRDRLAASLLSLSEALEHIEGVADTVLIRDAYILATGGLRAARKTAGLTVESVEAAQDAFREELEEIEVVQQTLTNTYDIALGDEEYDLIAELEALLNTHASSTESDVEYDLPDISKLNLGNPNAVTLIAEDEVIPSKSHLPIQS